MGWAEIRKTSDASGQVDLKPLIEAAVSLPDGLADAALNELANKEWPDHDSFTWRGRLLVRDDDGGALRLIPGRVPASDLKSEGCSA